MKTKLLFIVTLFGLFFTANTAKADLVFVEEWNLIIERGDLTFEFGKLDGSTRKMEVLVNAGVPLTYSKSSTKLFQLILPREVNSPEADDPILKILTYVNDPKNRRISLMKAFTSAGWVNDMSLTSNP